eukprot:1795868-Rhodomonas_salina.1
MGSKHDPFVHLDEKNERFQAKDWNNQRLPLEITDEPEGHSCKIPRDVPEGDLTMVFGPKMEPNTGSYYVEFKIIQHKRNYSFIGIGDDTFNLQASTMVQRRSFIGWSNDDDLAIFGDWNKQCLKTLTPGGHWVVNDVIGVFLNTDESRVQWTKNHVLCYELDQKLPNKTFLFMAAGKAGFKISRKYPPVYTGESAETQKQLGQQVAKLQGAEESARAAANLLRLQELLENPPNAVQNEQREVQHTSGVGEELLTKVIKEHYLTDSDGAEQQVTVRLATKFLHAEIRSAALLPGNQDGDSDGGKRVMERLCRSPSLSEPFMYSVALKRLFRGSDSPIANVLDRDSAAYWAQCDRVLDRVQDATAVIGDPDAQKWIAVPKYTRLEQLLFQKLAGGPSRETLQTLIQEYSELKEAISAFINQFCLGFS